jgi:hypothetical protein
MMVTSTRSRRASPRCSAFNKVAQHKWLDRNDLGTSTIIVYVVFLSFGSKECMQDGPIHSLKELLWLFVMKLLYTMV